MPASVERVGHLVHGEVPQRGQDLGHLGGEGRRRHHHLGRRTVGDHVARRHHHHPVGGGGHELHVVGGDHHGPTLGRQPVDDADQRSLGRVVEAPGGLVQQHDVGGGGQLDGQDQREPLALGEVPGVGGGRDARGQPVEQRPGADRRGVGRLPVGLVALLGHGVEVEEVGRGLGHEADQPRALAGARDLGSTPPTSTVPL